ncbi:MAG: LamG domain-containing protein [Planctomycetota bacterium]|jgi:hypothetical protein
MDKILLRSFLIVLMFVLTSCVSSPVQTEPVAEKTPPITYEKDQYPVGWWKFDEDAGNSATDSSKYQHKATLKGELSFDRNSLPGRIGKALNFEGNDDHVEVTGYKGITGTRPRTVTAWIKTKSSGGEIISWGSDDFGRMWKFGFVRGRIGVTPKGGYYYINDKIHDDKWHHVAVVVEEAELPNLHDNVSLYTDGSLAAIHDIGLLDLWPVNTGDEFDVRIGRGFKGLIDEVRLYNRPLSGEEIADLFKSDNSQPALE